MVKYLKITLGIALLVLFANDLNAQEIIKEFKQDSLTQDNLASLRSRFRDNKVLAPKYEIQILIALSYFPELKDTKIKFRIKNSTTPLTTRPTLYSMFRSAKKRTYIITISEKSTKYLDTILLRNLNYNAQIGVLGHELCHVSDYLNKGFSKMWNVVVLSLKYFLKEQLINSSSTLI